MPQPKVYLFDHSPHLRGEWDYGRNKEIDPEILTAKSHKKVWWLCKDGHSYDTIVHHRTRVSYSCPICNGSRILLGYNDLWSTDPELAREMVPTGEVTPENITRGSNKKATWRCKIGHQWDAVVASRALNGVGCPYCSNVRVLTGFNDLGTIRPDLAVDLADSRYRASELLFRSTTKVLWRCPIGHSYDYTVRQRERGLGCPICSNTVLLVGFNDIETVYPTLAAELKLETERKYICTYREKLIWLCEKGHEYSCSLYKRRSGTGCAYCKKKKLLTGFNDLATVDPNLAAELVSHDPKLVIEGSAQMLRWKCSLGHEWNAVASSRKTGVGCPYCSNNRTLYGFNDVASQFPDLLLEWDDETDPKSVIAGGHTKIQWKCTYDHLWVAEIKSRTLQGSSCPTCQNKQIVVGYNDLHTTRPDLSSQLVNKDRGYQITVGSASREVWQCTKGHVWESTVYQRSTKNSGCPKCSFQKTSRIEGRLRDLMSNLGHLVSEDHTYCLPVPYRKNAKMSVDIYLEVGPTKIVCEYDGAYFHTRESSIHRDTEKTMALLDEGYTVVRVRESPLVPLDIVHSNLLQLSVQYSQEDIRLSEAVDQIKQWLESKND